MSTNIQCTKYTVYLCSCMFVTCNILSMYVCNCTRPLYIYQFEIIYLQAFSSAPIWAFIVCSTHTVYFCISYWQCMFSHTHLLISRYRQAQRRRGRWSHPSKDRERWSHRHGSRRRHTCSRHQGNSQGQSAREKVGRAGNTRKSPRRGGTT